jgi:hypothetical protein
MAAATRSPTWSNGFAVRRSRSWVRVQLGAGARGLSNPGGPRTAVRCAACRSRSRQRPAKNASTDSNGCYPPLCGSGPPVEASNRVRLRRPPVPLPTAPRAVSAVPLVGSSPGVPDQERPRCAEPFLIWGG